MFLRFICEYNIFETRQYFCIEWLFYTAHFYCGSLFSRYGLIHFQYENKDLFPPNIKYHGKKFHIKEVAPFYSM